MDYTLLGLDNTLRPRAREVLQRLKDDGHTLYIWSGVGIRWKEVRELHLDDLITDCFLKPMPNATLTSEAYLQRVVSLPESELPVKPDFVVDDYPEVPTALGGMWVIPYYFSTPQDGDMERVYSVISDYTRTGHSDDERFRPRVTPRPT